MRGRMVWEVPLFMVSVIIASWLTGVESAVRLTVMDGGF